MAVFVVAVLMAGLGWYWAWQRRDASEVAKPSALAFAWPAAIYLALVLLLFASVAGRSCADAACEAAKRGEVAAYMIGAAGVLAGTLGAYLGGHRGARLWLLAAWPLPLLLAWAFA